MSERATTAPHTLTWLGRDRPYLDTPVVRACDRVVLGCYGGTTATGATKNEDGALIWSDAGGAWEVALLLDAHNSSESAALVLTTVAAEVEAIAALLARPAPVALPAIGDHFITRFSSASFRAACQRVQGETACLLCVRAAQFLWWLSIGDVVVYLLQPDLAALGQFALNQRQFFEWVGQVNTFALPVPCYTTGVRELRQDRNIIVLVTDGVLECGSRYFDAPEALYRAFFGDQTTAGDIATSVQAVLQRVVEERGVDSATVIAWEYRNPQPATLPS